MKKFNLSPEAQGTLWFCIATMTLGVLLAVILTFVSDFINFVIWGINV